jgi:hypothetical protein
MTYPATPGPTVRAWIATVAGQFNEVPQACEFDGSSSAASIMPARTRLLRCRALSRDALRDDAHPPCEGGHYRVAADLTIKDQTLESGGLLVGEEVKVLIDVSAVRA